MAKRRGTSPARRLAPFQVPKRSTTVCGWSGTAGSSENSRMVGERPSLSAQADSSARIRSSE